MTLILLFSSKPTSLISKFSFSAFFSSAVESSQVLVHHHHLSLRPLQIRHCRCPPGSPHVAISTSFLTALRLLALSDSWLLFAFSPDSDRLGYDLRGSKLHLHQQVCAVVGSPFLVNGFEHVAGRSEPELSVSATQGPSTKISLNP